MSMRLQCIMYATNIDLVFPPTLKLLNMNSLLEPRSEIRKVKENESSLHSSTSLVSPSLLLPQLSSLYPSSPSPPPPFLLHPFSPTPPPHPSSSSPRFFPSLLSHSLPPSFLPFPLLVPPFSIKSRGLTLVASQQYDTS